MTKDAPKVSPFATGRIAGVVTDEQRALFRRLDSWWASEAFKRPGRQDRSADVQRVREQLRELELARLDLEIAERERERAGRREAIRTLRAWLNRENGQSTVAEPTAAPEPLQRAKPLLVDHARRALTGKYGPEGRPPNGLKTDAILDDVRAWLAREPRDPGVPAPTISRDTLLRALGRRK